MRNRSQYVSIDSSTSCPSPVASGVPQGSVLGPTLFLIFINDICDVTSNLNVKCKLFADDLKIYATRSRHDLNTIDHLNIALSRIESWCSLWQLNLAPEKCSVLKISMTKPPLNPEPRFYILNGRQINKCSYIRDLGVLGLIHLFA